MHSKNVVTIVVVTIASALSLTVTPVQALRSAPAAEYGDDALHLFMDHAHSGKHMSIGYEGITLNNPKFINNGALGLMSDRLTSLIVPPGYHVVLYEHDNGFGRSLTLNAGRYNNLDKFKEVGGWTWNDKVSSLFLKRGRAPEGESGDSCGTLSSKPTARMERTADRTSFLISNSSKAEWTVWYRVEYLSKRKNRWLTKESGYCYFPERGNFIKEVSDHDALRWRIRLTDAKRGRHTR